MTDDGTTGGEHMVTTRSVTSAVIEAGTDATHADVHEGREEPDGHIQLLDWDDTPGTWVKETAGNQPGITIVLESSEGSYHAWNLCVDGLKTTACRMVLNEDDHSHVRTGLKRGYWRLRYAPKVWEGQDVYKEAPELVTVTVNNTDYPQSAGHYDLAAALWDLPDKPLGFEWVGESAGTKRYETLTDEGKEIRRGEMNDG